MAQWINEGEDHERLIVRGRANLLEGEADGPDLERIRTLFDDLERKRDIASFLELTDTGDGVRIFIGSENKLFSLSGSSLVVSPYMNADRRIIGAVGVIGPDPAELRAHRAHRGLYRAAGRPAAVGIAD